MSAKSTEAELAIDKSNKTAGFVSDFNALVEYMNRTLFQGNPNKITRDGHKAVMPARDGSIELTLDADLGAIAMFNQKSGASESVPLTGQMTMMHIVTFATSYPESVETPRRETVSAYRFE